MAEYIEREVAIKAIEEVVMAMESWVTDYQAQRHGLMTAITTLMDVPAADVVPVRHGRWTLLVSLNGDEHDKWKCSECGHYTRNGADRNFCPNCGAAMKDGDA